MGKKDAHTENNDAFLSRTKVGKKWFEILEFIGVLQKRFDSLVEIRIASHLNLNNNNHPLQPHFSTLSIQ